MRLVNILEIGGTIHLASGLHIGAGKDRVEIGGLDNPIIRNPRSNAPYIPGSSLKGKMRSLLESSLMGSRPDTLKALKNGKPCDCGKKDCPICVIFGVSGSVQASEELGPTRILVRDSQLTDEFNRLFEDGALPMEIKYENTIDRCTGIANPRPLERVPAGVEFAMNIALRVYEGDNMDRIVNFLISGLKLLELDALGGCGSRGSGEVRFQNIMIDNILKYRTLEEIKPFAMEKAL